VRTPAQSNRRAAVEAAYRAAGQTGSLPYRPPQPAAGRPAWGSIAVILALMLLVGVIGLRGVSESNARCKPSTRTRKTDPSNLANKMMFLLRHRSQIMLALQHDPANPSAKLHDHPLDLHVENTLKNRSEINAALDELKKHKLSEQEQALFAKFSATRERYSSEGINVARGLLKDGHYQQANELLLLKINPLYAEMKRDGEA
jgi:hypothetical protein